MENAQDRHDVSDEIFKVTNGTIHNWVTEAANGLPAPAVSDDTSEIEFDEMWHYIVKKTKTVGHQSS